MKEWEPMWSSEVKIESGGRYALKLNTFHDDLESFLIPSIINAANRLRYFSYCCWIIGDIEESCDCKTYEDFVEAFRRRENALAIGTYLLKPDYSVYGSIKLSTFVSDENKLYDCSFKLMESKNMGAFELYYKGTIYNWGLIEELEHGIIRLTDAGRRIYEIVKRYYIKSSYYNDYKGKKVVPGKVLKQWAQVNGLDNIIDNNCSDEREFYKDIIFRLNVRYSKDFRRDTLAFFLECIDTCSNSITEFNEDVLRNIHYYGTYFSRDGVLKDFNISDCYDDLVFYWCVYEGHVYFRWWIDTYLRLFLNSLKSSENGLSLNEFISKIDIDEFNQIMARFLNVKRDHYNSPIKSIMDIINAPSKLDDTYSEENVCMDKKYNSFSAKLAKLVLSTINLVVKFKGMRGDKRYAYLQSNLMTDLWFENMFLHYPNIHSMKVCDFLQSILKKYVIDRHDEVMFEKRDLRRCWFTKENNRYIFQADEAPIWRPAKYVTIMNFLYDMNLIQDKDDLIVLTDEGRHFYNDVLKVEYYR